MIKYQIKDAKRVQVLDNLTIFILSLDELIGHLNFTSKDDELF